MHHRTPLLLAALACAFAASAQVPGGLTKDDVKARQVRIEEQYDQSQARCRRLQGPPRELCNEQARGERDIQSAELQLLAEPTGQNDHKLRLAKAEATYSQSLLRCKSLDGDARGVCRADAKTSYVQAKDEARLQSQVAEQTLRSELAVRTRAAEGERIAQAQLNAARVRCEALPAEGRAGCLEDAKKRFASE